MPFETRVRLLRGLGYLTFGCLLVHFFWSPPWLEWVVAGLILVLTLFAFSEALLTPHRRALEAAMRKTAQQQADWEASQRRWAEIQKRLGQP